jgi:hypothetical protein
MAIPAPLFPACSSWYSGRIHKPGASLFVGFLNHAFPTIKHRAQHRYHYVDSMHQIDYTCDT